MVRVMLSRIADDRPMMPFDAVELVAIDAMPADIGALTWSSSMKPANRICGRSRRSFAAKKSWWLVTTSKSRPCPSRKRFY
jgi:hypothetical protein